MDILDQAQANDELFRQAALHAHFAGRKNNSDVESRPETGQHLIGAAPVKSPSFCIDCDDEIEPERLEALPYAVRCVDCQTKKERRERSGG